MLAASAGPGKTGKDGAVASVKLRPQSTLDIGAVLPGFGRAFGLVELSTSCSSISNSTSRPGRLCGVRITLTSMRPSTRPRINSVFSALSARIEICGLASCIRGSQSSKEFLPADRCGHRPPSVPPKPLGEAYVVPGLLDRAYQR